MTHIACPTCGLAADLPAAYTGMEPARPALSFCAPITYPARVRDLGPGATVAALLDEQARAAAQGSWAPACGGSETVTTYRTGRRLLYCWQASTGRHAYLDTDTDLVLDDDEARMAIGF